MKDILQRIAELCKVKTIVTFLVVSVFVILSLREVISADNVMLVVSMVISFYFGTQHEKNGTAQR